MKTQILIVLFIIGIAYGIPQQWPDHCPLDQAIKAFRNKTI